MLKPNSNTDCPKFNMLTIPLECLQIAESHAQMAQNQNRSVQ